MSSERVALDRATQAGSDPVLVGTLVDPDGHAIPSLSTTLNCWSEGGCSGGQQIETDKVGRFRIELSSSFIAASCETRTLGLVGSEGEVAVLDARRAWLPGFNDIGDLLFSDAADPHTLRRLSDDQLLSRLEGLTHFTSDACDACLQECGRRGGQRIIAFLSQREHLGDGATDTVVVTSRNRALGVADPLLLELVDGGQGAIPCSVGDLPTVRITFVNRDPLRRTLKFTCTEDVCHDLSIAVACDRAAASGDDPCLLRASHRGAWPTGKDYELAPGEEVVIPVRLSHYLWIKSPGRYVCRMAFRTGGSWDLGEDAKHLPQGLLFVYSQPFVLDVSPTDK